MLTARIKLDKDTEEVGKKRRINIERCKVDMKIKKCQRNSYSLGLQKVLKSKSNALVSDSLAL